MGLFSPTFETLHDLYLNELRDLYSSETQLLVALPLMADSATSSQLKEAFTAHLEETEVHVSRLEEIFDALGEEPGEEACKAMEGLIAEGEADRKLTAIAESEVNAEAAATSRKAR